MKQWEKKRLELEWKGMGLEDEESVSAGIGVFSSEDKKESSQNGYDCGEKTRETG